MSDGAQPRTMSVTTLLYNARDREAVLDLWRESGIDRPWLDLEAEIDAMLQHDGSLFLIAVDDSQIVGAVMGAFDGRRGYIYHLAVQSDRRGDGTGWLLMERLEDLMRDRGVGKVNLQVRSDNAEVVEFYRRLGYVDDQLVSMGKRLTN
jgi:ribosomal protein S18 acetylase RimI-like enzyme